MWNQLDALTGCLLYTSGTGGIKVAQGHQRLNAVLVALIKELLIEAQALFVGPVSYTHLDVYKRQASE